MDVILYLLISLWFGWIDDKHFAKGSSEVHINGNITAEVNSNDIKLECSFTLGEGNAFYSTALTAENATTDKFIEIAGYLRNTKPLFTPFGMDLFGNETTLINFDENQNKFKFSFDNVKCRHERRYKCFLYVTSSSSVFPRKFESDAIWISVTVSPSKPDQMFWMKVSEDPSTTQKTHMPFSTLSASTEVPTKLNESSSTLDSGNQYDKSLINLSTVSTSDHITPSSTTSNGYLYSNVGHRTTYFTQQKTTVQGIAEGDNVTIFCTGDVGNPPAELVIEKYINGKIASLLDTIATTSTSKISENCSYYRTTNLTFQITAADNNAVIRCVVNSSMAESDRLYLETAPLEVYLGESTPSISGTGDNKAKDSGTLTAIAIVIVLIVIGALVALIFQLCRRSRKKEDYKSVDRMESNMDQIESQETTQTVPSTSSTKKTTGYEDIDLNDTDMKFKFLSDEETINQVKQHNEEYLKKLKEGEEREKDNPTQPPQAAVYACVNKPKNTTTTENKPPAGQLEEDVYEDSKEGLYDTSGDRRHQENITVENYDSTENLKNEESDHNDPFSEPNNQIGAYISKTYGSSENKEEKRQVATVSPTVRLSSSSQCDGQKYKSDEIQPKTEKLTTQETYL